MLSCLFCSGDVLQDVRSLLRVCGLRSLLPGLHDCSLLQCMYWKRDMGSSHIAMPVPRLVRMWGFCTQLLTRQTYLTRGYVIAASFPTGLPLFFYIPQAVPSLAGAKRTGFEHQAAISDRPAGR